jgi:hypothetical protein
VTVDNLIDDSVVRELEKKVYRSGVFKIGNKAIGNRQQ